MRNVKIITGLMLYACICALVHAQAPSEVFVSPNGTGSGYPGWADAMSDIQAAVNLVAPNGTVWVSNGTWKLSSRIEVGDHKTIRGYYGTNTPGMESIVSGDDKTGCFTLNSGVLDGLVISDGRAASAAGVSMNGGTMMCCRVEGNIATNSSEYYGNGGAIELFGACLVSNCTIIRNEFRLNPNGGDEQHGGSAVYFADTNAVVMDCVIRENINRLNSPYENGTVFFYQGGKLQRSTIAWNTNYGAVCYVVDTSFHTDNALISECNISSNDFPDIEPGKTASAIKLYNSGVLATNCIIDGNINSRGVYVYGGARLFSSHIRNHNNVGHGGAGVWMYGSNTLVADCTIENNSIATNAYAQAYGAGVAMGVQNDTTFCGTIIDSIIRSNVNNRLDTGGGIGIRGKGAVVSNCFVVNNEKKTASRDGGGIGIREKGSAIITHSVISSNKSFGVGGGIACFDDSTGTVIIRNCLITDNEANRNGGGVYLANTWVESCTIAGNRTGSGYNGGGLYSSSSGDRIINTIVYSNTSTEVGASNWFCSAAGVTWSNNCTMPLAGSAGGGNIAQDPKFTDTAAGQYQLQAASPCINTGVNQPEWMTGAVDLNSQRRIDKFSGIVDMGCYEYIFRGTFLFVR